MKKLILVVLFLGCLAAFTDAQAQTAQSTTTSSSKDEFWGTKKLETQGASAEAVGARGANVDKRLNTYEGTKQGRFTRTKFNVKKMKEIEKKEKKMLKKYNKEKKKRARRSRR